METKKPEILLSASSIKNFETCTWLFYCQNILKIPQRTNEGAIRGTIVHLIFELMLNPRHKKHFNTLIKHKHIKFVPGLDRLVLRHLKEQKILTTSNYEMCSEMIIIGLKQDFFGKNDFGKVKEPEYKFEIHSESPKYKIRGFIDKIIEYPGNKIKIVDYKSSKKKFKDEELDSNIQAFTYSMVGYKNFKAKDVITDFVFLRYPKEPIQSVHVSKEQISSFENYLAHIYSQAQNFTEVEASTNLAAHSPKKAWLCKAGSWQCPFYAGFEYYVLFNKEGEKIKSSLEKDLKPKDGEVIKKFRYHGCIAHRQEKTLDF